MSCHSVDADTPMLMNDLSWVVLLDICTHACARAIVPVLRACAIEPVPSSLCLRACAIEPVPSSLCHRSPTHLRMIMKMMMIPSSNRWKLEMTSVVDEPNVFVAATSNRSHLSMAMVRSTNDYTLCEVFESMESMALRTQTDVGLFWWRTYTLLIMTRHGWELHPMRWDILIIPYLIAHFG